MMSSLLLTLYRPGPAFESAGERSGGWIIPFLADWILFVATAAISIHYLPMSQAQTMASYIVTGFLGVVVSLAITGGLYIFGLMTTKKPGFLAMLEMVSLAIFPWRLLSLAMAITIVAAAPDKHALDFTNLLATNVAAYMNKATTSAEARALLTSVDVVDFCEIVMLSYGYARVARTKIVWGASAVMTLWLLNTSAKVIGTLASGKP